jgi:C-terminal processing protease CtpA/Prc
MSGASGRYLLLAALIGAACILALVWNRAPRAVPERVHDSVGTAEHAATAKLNAATNAVESPAAVHTAPADLTGLVHSAPAAALPLSEQASLPLEERQLAKIAHGMRPNPAGGILVEATPPGSVVGQLRLQPGDVIVSVNGVAVTTPEQFARTYREQGSPRELTILRNGTEFHLHN